MDTNSLAHTKWECKYYILEYDQMSLVEYIDPFSGVPVRKNKK